MISFHNKLRKSTEEQFIFIFISYHDILKVNLESGILYYPFFTKNLGRILGLNTIKLNKLQCGSEGLIKIKGFQESTIIGEKAIRKKGIVIPNKHLHTKEQ